MYKDLPPYIKGNSKKAQENRTEMIFANLVTNQLILSRLAKLEAFLTKKTLKSVHDEIDKEAERIAAAALKELDAFYDEK